MKQTTGKQKVARSVMPVREQEAGAGTQGGALSPPPQTLAAVDSQPVQRMVNGKSENRTGLPDRLKAGVEQLSGLAMDDVRVHYNSAKPAQLQALAYTQGTEIHVGPGQERHLPHEAWHVVQQKRGRIQLTTQLKGGVSVNDDKGLEHEADVMGAQAISQRRMSPTMLPMYRPEQTKIAQPKVASAAQAYKPPKVSLVYHPQPKWVEVQATLAGSSLLTKQTGAFPIYHLQQAPKVLQKKLSSVQSSHLKPESVPVNVRLTKVGAVIQRMEMDEFRNIIERKSIKIDEFREWFSKEFTIWQNIGAFNETKLGYNAAGSVVYKEKYKTLQDYIEDEAFSEKILAFHIRDFQEKTGYVDDAQYHQYLNFDRQVTEESSILIKEMKNLNSIDGLKYTKGLNPVDRALRVQKTSFPEMYEWIMENREEIPKAFNCWEACLIAGFRAGLITKERIRKLISREGIGSSLRGQPYLMKIMLESGKTLYKYKDKSQSGEERDEWRHAVTANWNMIPAGCLVGFNYAAHVAVSLGRGEVLEFDASTGEKVRQNSINAIMKASGSAYSESVTWAPYETILEN